VGQHVVTTGVTATPAPDRITTHADVFGNTVHVLSVEQPHADMEVVGTSEVVVDLPPPWPSGGPSWDAPEPPGDLLVADCRLASPMAAATPAVVEYARASFPPGRPLTEAAADLASRIFHDFTFDPSFSDVATPLDDVLAFRRGVCQDFAHLAIAGLRAHGAAARYVSGYLETDPPPGQPKLVGSDASHAWFSVFVPGSGWLDADPTNDQIPPRRHVTCAWGRDYGDVAPVRGVVYGPPAAQHLAVAVDVTRLD
jgi:transglutaminase-like putative cysteine protease